MHQDGVHATHGLRSTGSALAMAEAILKPIMGPQKGAMVKLTQGDDAISFALERLPMNFKPHAGTVIKEVVSLAHGASQERTAFYLVDYQGRLVRLSAFTAEAGAQLCAFGAIYIGEDRGGALRHALMHAERLRH